MRSIETKPRLLPYELFQFFRWILRSCDFTNPAWQDLGEKMKEESDSECLKVKVDYADDILRLKDRLNFKHLKDEPDHCPEMIKTKDEEPHHSGPEEFPGEAQISAQRVAVRDKASRNVSIEELHTNDDENPQTGRKGLLHSTEGKWDLDCVRALASN